MALVNPATATGSTGSSSTSYNTYLTGTLYDTLAAAKNEANIPYQAYTGQRIAGFTPEELQSFQQTRDLQGAGQPLYNQANDVLQQGVQGLSNLGQMPSTFGVDQLNQYMNPYIQGVVNNTTDEALRTSQQELNRLRGNAGLSGAFGGSRQAIAEQELFGNTQRNLNSTIADLYNSGYTQSLDQFNKDRQFGIDRLQPYQQYASSLSGLADNNQAYKLKDTEALYNSGNIQRNLAQTGLDTAYQDWTNQRDYNKGQIGFLSNLVNGVDMSEYATGQTTSQSNTYPSSNTTSSILGGLSTGLGFLSNSGILDGIFGKSGKTTYAEGGLVKGYASGGNVNRGRVRNPGRATYEDPSYETDPAILAWLKENISNPIGGTLSGLGRDIADYFPSRGPGETIGDLYQAATSPAGMPMASAPTNISEVATQPFVPTRYDTQFGPPAPTEGQMVEASIDGVNPDFQAVLSGLTGGGAKGAPGVSQYNPAGANKSGGATTMADLFPSTDTPMDSMFQMNPLIAIGLGLLGSSGNPNDAGYQFASGLGNALETYEGMKDQRQQTSDKRGEAVANAMSRQATNEYNSQMLQEQLRRNQVSEDLARRTADINEATARARQNLYIEQANKLVRGGAMDPQTAAETVKMITSLQQALAVTTDEATRQALEQELSKLATTLQMPTIMASLPEGATFIAPKDTDE